MHTIRRLEIYDLCGIGNSDTIKLSKWLTDIFYSMLIYKHAYFTYYRDSSGTTLIYYDRASKKLLINYSNIWSILEDNYCYNHNEVRMIMSYIIFKHFGITKCQIELSHYLSSYDKK